MALTSIYSPSLSIPLLEAGADGRAVPAILRFNPFDLQTHDLTIFDTVSIQDPSRPFLRHIDPSIAGGLIIFTRVNIRFIQQLVGANWLRTIEDHLRLTTPPLRPLQAGITLSPGFILLHSKLETSVLSKKGTYELLVENWNMCRAWNRDLVVFRFTYGVSRDTRVLSPSTPSVTSPVSTAATDGHPTRSSSSHTNGHIDASGYDDMPSLVSDSGSSSPSTEYSFHQPDPVNLDELQERMRRLIDRMRDRVSLESRFTAARQVSTSPPPPYAEADSPTHPFVSIFDMTAIRNHTRVTLPITPPSSPALHPLAFPPDPSDSVSFGPVAGDAVPRFVQRGYWYPTVGGIFADIRQHAQLNAHQADVWILEMSRLDRRNNGRLVPFELGRRAYHRRRIMANVARRARRTHRVQATRENTVTVLSIPVCLRLPVTQILPQL